MGPDTLIIRADAGPEMGAGHVMRCVALGQAWQDAGGRVVVASARLPDALRARVEKEGFEFSTIEAVSSSVEDAEATRRLASRLGAQWVALDGYHFDAEYRHAIRGGAWRVLWVHDVGPVAHDDVDLVVQPGPAAGGRASIGLHPTVRMAWGSRFTLIRRELNGLRQPGRPVSPRVTRILLSFGGGDDHGMVEMCLGVVGGLAADTHVRILSSGMGRSSIPIPSSLEGRVELIDNPINVAEQMLWADLAVSGAGGTCWEQALLGLPAILVAMAENQLPNALAAQLGGVARFLGSHGEVSERVVGEAVDEVIRDHLSRSEMRSRGEALVDGKGAERLVRTMMAEQIRVRPAEDGDCELLFGWTNDPDVRAQSFSSEPVRWESHQAWFKGMREDPDSLIFIGETDEGEPIGTVRFSRNGTEATIGVSVARTARGRGYATPLIMRGVEGIVRNDPPRLIHAFIKVDNVASVRAFEAAAFEHVEHATVRGCPAHHLVWKAGTEGDGHRA